MSKSLATLTIIFGIVIIIFGVIVLVYPQWLDVPGGWLILLGAVFVGVAGLGDKIKGWADFLFGEESKPKKRNKESVNQAIPKLNVAKNIMMGKNKIRVENDNANVIDNTMVGENQVDVSKRSKKTRSK